MQLILKDVGQTERIDFMILVMVMMLILVMMEDHIFCPRKVFSGVGVDGVDDGDDSDGVDGGNDVVGVVGGR